MAAPPRIAKCVPCMAHANLHTKLFGARLSGCRSGPLQHAAMSKASAQLHVKARHFAIAKCCGSHLQLTRHTHHLDVVERNALGTCQNKPISDLHKEPFAAHQIQAYRLTDLRLLSSGVGLKGTRLPKAMKGSAACDPTPVPNHTAWGQRDPSQTQVFESKPHSRILPHKRIQGALNNSKTSCLSVVFAPCDPGSSAHSTSQFKCSSFANPQNLIICRTLHQLPADHAPSSPSVHHQ